VYDGRVIVRFEIDLEPVGGAPELDRLTAGERAYCEARAHPAMHAAARVAAKRAVLRALGLAPEDRWALVEVERDALGRPSARLHGEAAGAFDRIGARSIHLTLTHTATHAAAAVLLED